MADSNRKGAFLLSDVRQRSLDGFWETVQTNAQFGWAAGGFPALNSVSRIDFANDTVTASGRGNLTVAREQLAGVSNASYGWFIGGLTPAPAAISLVDRIDFANDGITATTRGPITTTTYGGSAVGNQYFGWHTGGLTPTITSTVTRIAWASDSPTAASVRGPLNQTSYAQAAVSNNVYGWWAGGYVPAATSVVGRIDFSNDSPTAATVRGPLSLVRTQLAGAANANYGWFGGGVNPSPFYLASRVDRVDFSNDTLVTVVRGNLPTVKRALAATGNQNYGWFTGGYTQPGFPGYKSTVDRIDYSNDSPASASPRGFIATRSSHAAVAGIANLPQYPTQMSLGTNQPVAGYGWIAGGSSGFTQVNRIDFANDSPTTASVRAGFNLGFTTRPYMAATGNANYGWFAGGTSSPSAQNESLVTRIDYSNDSPASGSPRGFLSVARQQLGATGNANYGWWGGGAISSAPLVPTSYVDRIDFANDSPTAASPRGLLSSARYATAATGNANYGWWTGGWSTSQLARIDFSNDSPAASSVRGLQSVLRGGQAATSNSNYGWFGGGLISLIPGSARSIVDRIDFANDSPASASPRGPLSVSRTQLAAVGNANYGWFAGGGYNVPSQSSTVDRIDFANDSPTAASPRGPLSRGDTGLSGTSNYVKPSIGQITLARPFIGGRIDGTYGWFGGGYAIGAPSVIYSQIDRIDFSNDSPATASVRGILTLQRRDLAATGNANYGWFVAGRDPTFRSSIDRVSWANDSPTSASARGFLSSDRIRHTGTGNANYGWFAGGQTSSPGAISTVDRIDYANDSPTNTTIRGSLSSIRLWPMATANANYGWFGGGYNAAFFSLVDRIDFANDSPTAASPRGLLSSARYKISATSNANYGWFAGGIILGGSLVSTVDRIDFSNDSPTSASPRGPLTAIRYQQAGAGNTGYGWHGGGFTPGGNQSTVERIDYSNDSPTSASSRGPLSVSRFSLGASSNYVKLPPQINIAQYNIGVGSVGIGVGTYGWFGGGYGPLSTVDRINFSNDSPTSASPRGLLSTSRSEPAAAGNANYGWFGGGQPSSSVDRIDFANDSPISASPRGPLSIARYGLAATGNANYGWFGGGYGVTRYSTVDRIDFSNDSPASTSVRGPLSEVRSAVVAAVSNNNYAWFGGGAGAGATNVSTVDRIDFSNDSPTAASPRGPLSAVRYRLAAAGNANYGWFGGGANVSGNAVSTVDRIDFANDSPTAASPRGPLSSIQMRLAATSNANYGWFGGGGGSAGVNGSTVDRIDFSNDSPTSASPRGLLSTGRRGLSATSNYVR